MDFSAPFLFASLFWSSVATGYFIYGKRQQETIALIGGIVMFGVSCVVWDSLYMSLICIGICVAVYVLIRKGY